MRDRIHRTGLTSTNMGKLHRRAMAAREAIRAINGDGDCLTTFVYKAPDRALTPERGKAGLWA